MSWLLHQHNLQFIISPSQIPLRFLISQSVTWMWAIKNTMLISKILKACFVFSHKLMCESGEKNRKLRRIQKAEKNKPLSCLSKRKQVCQLPVDLLICSNFKTAFFFYFLCGLGFYFLGSGEEIYGINEPCFLFAS